MKRVRRLALASAALAVILCAGSAASARSSLQPLSPEDARLYVAAFAASARGDFIGAQMQTIRIEDKSLVGYLSYDQLMHPKAHRATFEELKGWLGKFRDLPLASRIFSLAVKRKPTDASDPPLPRVALESSARDAPSRMNERDRQAREAFSAGDSARALSLAARAGDRWMQGLAAYRLAAYDKSLAAFRDLARDTDANAWVRSAAAFWGARAATALGDPAGATQELKLAAQAPQTFYGMIAARQLQQRSNASADDPVGLLLISFSPTGAAHPAALVSRDPRAHRAAALAQLGRLGAAADELRAGMVLARGATEKAQWEQLGLALGAPVAIGLAGGMSATEAYPTPPLAPRGGFTLDKALVYAMVRQESRFDPRAVSPKGAVGLMQLTTAAAVRAAGDDKLKRDMSPLFDPAMNLRVGQDYFTWLMDRMVGHDLLRAVAAYNGGPGMVLNAVEMLGADASDPLLLMESLPAPETRFYVQKVLAGYWIYKAMFGEEARSLDALAADGQMIDARLELPQATRTVTQLSGELLKPALR